MKLLGKKSLSWGLKKALDVVWWLLIVGLGLVVVWIGALAVARAVYGTEVETDSGLSFSGPVFFEMEPESGEATSPYIKHAFIKEGAGTLEYKGWWPAAMIATTVVILLLGGLALFVLRQLRFLFQTFVESDPFASENFRRLRRIAFGGLLIHVLGAFYYFVLSSMFVDEFSFEGMTLVARADISWSGLFALGVIYVLSEIFRVGAKLEEEKALTV